MTGPGPCPRHVLHPAFLPSRTLLALAENTLACMDDAIALGTVFNASLTRRRKSLASHINNGDGRLLQTWLNELLDAVEGDIASAERAFGRQQVALAAGARRAA